MTRRAPSFESAVARAREADILGVAERLGVRLKKASSEWVGPCPRCGGCDRFAINARKQIFNCRRCCVGGDAIAFAGFVSGSSFAEVVALINDESSTFMDKRDGKSGMQVCRA